MATSALDMSRKTRTVNALQDTAAALQLWLETDGQTRHGK